MAINRLIAFHNDKSYSWEDRNKIAIYSQSSPIDDIVYGYKNAKSFIGLTIDNKLVSEEFLEKKQATSDLASLNETRRCRLFLIDEKQYILYSEGKKNKYNLSGISCETLYPILPNIPHCFTIAISYDQIFYCFEDETIIQKIHMDSIDESKTIIPRQFAQRGKNLSLSICGDQLAVGTSDGEIYILETSKSHNLLYLFQVKEPIEFIYLSESVLFAGSLKENIIYQWIKNEKGFPLLPSRKILDILPGQLYDLWGGKNEIGIWTGKEFIWKNLINIDLENLNKITNQRIFKLDKDFTEFNVDSKDFSDQLLSFFSSSYMKEKIKEYLLFEVDLNSVQKIKEIEESEADHIILNHDDTLSLITLKQVKEEIVKQRRWEELGDQVKELVSKEGKKFENLSVRIVSISDEYSEKEHILIKDTRPEFSFIYFFANFQDGGIKIIQFGTLYNFHAFREIFIFSDFYRFIINIIPFESANILILAQILKEAKSRLTNHEINLYKDAKKLIRDALR